MIEIKVEEYCNKCPLFEVEQKTDHILYAGKTDSFHVLSCKNKEICKVLCRHLQKEREENGSNGDVNE